MMLEMFRRNAAGGVAPMFALAFVPVAGFVGASVDYSRASAARADLQAALDAAALIVFRSAATSTTAQLTDMALAAVKAQFTRPEVQALTVQATYTTNPSTVTVTGSTSVRSDFMGIVGFPQMNIKTSSTVTWGYSKLRVSLALDNTGSMADAGKMDALKTATHNLLSTLQATSRTPGDVQVAIVPFAKDVNVGAALYTSSWIDWTTWDTQNFRIPSNGRNAFCDPAWAGYCFDGYSAVQKSPSWPVAYHSTWKGCVTDRDQDYDVKSTAPIAGTRPTMFPAENNMVFSGSTVVDYCPVALKPLSYDWAGMNALVDQMKPTGTTNQPIGLVWAWHALTPGAPLNPPPIDPGLPTQQYIILLSDGLNTQDRWYGNGSSTSTQVDARMSLVCSNAKAAGMQIYTVQVNTGGDPTSTVLQNCASSPDKFFMLTTASGIVSTFQTISTQLAALRIAK